MRNTSIELTAHPSPFEGITAEDIRAFFVQQPIPLPEPTPFQGYTPEEMDLFYADLATDPAFADGAGEER